MKLVGKTSDGKMVVSGVAALYFQDGLPLSVVFDLLTDKGCVPSWIHLYNEMKQNGMKDERIRHLLNEHIFESYGKEYRDEVMRRLDTALRTISE